MAVGGIGFVYALLKRTDWVAIILFTAIIADVNFDVPGMPLNFRAMASVLLLFKVMQEKKVGIPSFFSEGYTWQITFFTIYVLLISAKFGLFNMDMFKEFILALISAYLGYYFYFRDKGYQVFKTSIILGGLVCFGDLAYTYALCGGFPVQRFYLVVTGGFTFFNHNFFGYVCGAAFVFLLSDYLNSEKKDKISLMLLPVMFLGVLLSTSRSSLLMVIIVAVVLIAKGLSSQKKGKKAHSLIMITIACFFITIFMFSIVRGILGPNNEFMTTITARMIDEPMAMLNRALGNSYNENSLDSMDWRAEASTIAYDAYVGLLPEEQAFGIGYNGFLYRDYGHGYDAHNGVLLMMIEFGLFGFLFYMVVLGKMVMKAQRLKLSSPFVVTLIYMFLYVTSHNKELTAFFCFLVTGTLAAQLRHVTIQQEEELQRYKEIRMAANR